MVILFHILQGIELWSELKTELSRNISEKQSNQNSTGLPNNGQSGEEHSSQEIPVAKVKEGPIQHGAMRLGEVEEEHIQHWAMCLAEVKEEPIQHWAMCLGEMKEEPGQNWAMSGMCFIVLLYIVFGFPDFGLCFLTGKNHFNFLGMQVQKFQRV